MMKMCFCNTCGRQLEPMGVSRLGCIWCFSNAGSDWAIHWLLEACLPADLNDTARPVSRGSALPLVVS